MTDLICEFCNKQFTVKSSLKTHQRSAKYCLQIQNKNNNVSYECTFCNKTFSSKHRYQGHLDICTTKLKQIIQETENSLELANMKIKELELKLQTQRVEIENEMYKQDRETLNEIAKQPRQVNNNTQNKIIVTTPLDLSTNNLSSIIDSGLAEEHLIMGQKGIAQFAFNNFLKDDEGKLKYVCTDPSRQIFQFKNKEGDLEKDVRASKLTKALCDADIKNKSHEILADFIKDGDDDLVLEYIQHYQNIRDMETDNSDFSKELTTLVV